MPSRFNLRRIIYICFSIGLIAGLSYLLGWSDFLTVRNIKVQGTNSIDLVTTEISSAGIELKVGQRLARVDARAINRTLNLANWLSEVKTSRNWFNREVSISVSERIPIAKFIDADGQSKNFDPQGVQFVPRSADQISMQMQIPTINAASPATGANNQVSLQLLSKFLSQFPVNGGQYIKQLSQLGVDSQGNIKMQTVINGRAIEINWGGVEQLDKKVKVMDLLLLQPENEQATSIDLSIPGQPTVR